MIRLALVCFIVGVGALFPALSSAAETSEKMPVLKTGFVEFPPFKYADEEGNASGPWVEMTETVAAEAGFKVDWVHLPIARVYLYLETGQIDFWPGVAGIPQLQDFVHESSVSPMRVVLYAFHRKSAEPPDSLQFLVDKRLIVINGFSYLGALRDLPLKKEGLSYAPGHESALRMLELGRGRYVLDYDEPVRAVKSQFPNLDLTGTPIFTARGAFVFSRVNPDSKKLVNQFDRAYQRLVENGQLETLQ